MSSIIPQIIVTLSPDGELIAELPGRATRHKIELGKLRTAGQKLYDLLHERKAEIELAQAQQAEAAAQRKAQARKPKAQPDWRLIAQHSEALIIERLPTIAKELRADKSDKTLEEMGL